MNITSFFVKVCRLTLSFVFMLYVLSIVDQDFFNGILGKNIAKISSTVTVEYDAVLKVSARIGQNDSTGFVFDLKWSV